MTGKKAGSNSTTSNQLTDRTPPSTPTGLSVTPSSTSISLAWNPSTDNVGVAGYKVYLDSTATGTTSSTAYTASSLTCGTSHSVGVAAYDAAGNVSNSATAGGSTSPCPPATPPNFVTRTGTKLYLNGQPYRFAGLNFFQANMTQPIENCSSWDANRDLDNQLSLMGPDRNVLRAWFFQKMATSGGTRNWAAFDHTLAVAKAHGYKVIATLADQWNYCEGPYKDKSWYTDGYRTAVLPGNTVPYRRWVAEVTNRYKDDPTIAMWELVNEPEIQTAETDSSCPSDALAVIKAWAGDVSSLIKATDHNHLVSLGTGGNGNCGLKEGNYATVHALPTLDICSYHDYWGAFTALATDPYNGIQLRLDQCKALDKPIYAGEAGIKVEAVTSLAQRASLFSAKLNAQLNAGAVGFIAWNWSRTSNIDYRIGPEDPALDVLVLP